MMPTDPAPVNTDCHFHVFPAGLPGVAGARYVPPYGAPLERWRSGARIHGVGRGVVVQPSFLGTDNTVLLQALQQDPARLRGVAVVAPQADAAMLQALHHHGVRAIRLNLVGTDHDVSRNAGHTLFDALAALGWHVEVHVDPGRLVPVLQQLPSQLAVVADHFGKPAHDSEIDAAVRGRAGRLWVKLSAPYRLGACTPQRLAARWLALLGPARLVWGSDWPCTAHEQQQAAAQDPRAVRDWLGSEAVAEQVLCGNPGQLYGFGAAAEAC